MIPEEPWRESQCSMYLAFSCADEVLKYSMGQAIEEIVGEITRLPHLRRHQHDVRDLVGLLAACRSYYQKVEEILDLMYKYLEIGHHHGDRDQHSSNPPRMMIENLRRLENPLFLIIGGGEEYQFLRDSRMFRNTPRNDASSFTNADMSFLQQFCDGSNPERIESALGVAVACIKVDAECRHTSAELLAVRHIETMSPEVFGQMLYFHYCRRSSLQARQKARIEELEATVNNMLNVEDDLRAQNARLLNSLHSAEEEAEIAENELDAERTLRQQAEASRGRAVRRAEHRLRDEYARQHDEWYHDVRNYRTYREQYRPALQNSVEAPSRASGNDRSWLSLRLETRDLCTDLELADKTRAVLDADLSRVIR